MIAETVSWTLLLAVSVLVALLLILGFLLLRHDPDVGRTRFGFFVERERYSDEPPWPELRPPADRTLPRWPDRDKTVELPPDTDA